MPNEVDISENDILKHYPKVMEMLLKDHTTNEHIIWATDSYESRGEGFQFKDQITIEHITGDNGSVIRPRALKSKAEQEHRIKDKAEVFTPSWVCNAQNNLIDEAWFGRKDTFNICVIDEDGTHDWLPVGGKISFENTGKTWEDYIRDTRMEITCGEGPYMTSRYDTTTGLVIPVERRIGLLDRKLRVVNEHVTSIEEWRKWAKIACKNIYGFEWQGDNLLLAREALLYTVLDYYDDVLKKLHIVDKRLQKMHSETILSFAEIISWNVWQMDGLKFVIPETCHDTVLKEQPVQMSLFGGASTEPSAPKTIPCPGCATGNIYRHNGIQPMIRNWGVFDNDHPDKNGLKGKERCDIKFVDLITMNNI